MSKTLTVFNVSRGYSVRIKKALRAIEQCACAWVEEGVSIRDLNLAESISARMEQAKKREPLPYAEVFGLKYEPPVGGQAQYREERLLAYEATLYAGLVTAPRTAP